MADIDFYFQRIKSNTANDMDFPYCNISSHAILLGYLDSNVTHNAGNTRTVQILGQTGTTILEKPHYLHTNK